MTPRKLRASDIPILQSFQQGFEYPDPLDPMIEAIVVVADENDRPRGWFIGKRICEVYAGVDPSLPAPVRMQILRIGHGCLGMLATRGYTHVEVFIAPQIRALGRRLARSFGWTRNWASWTRKL